MNAAIPPQQFSDAELIAFVDGVADDVAAKAITAALENDPNLAARIGAIEAIRQPLASPPPEVDFVGRVRRAQADARREQTRPVLRFGLAGSALAAAAAVMIGILVPASDPASAPGQAPSEFVARAADGPSYFFRPYRVTRTELQPIPRAGAIVHRDDPLTFNFGGAKAPGSYLAVFILAGDEVFWCVPFWDPDAAVPTLLPVQDAKRDLPSHQVAHDLPVGQATMVAWFSDQQLKVDEVERRLAASKSSKGSVKTLTHSERVFALTGGEKIMIPLEVVRGRRCWAVIPLPRSSDRGLPACVVPLLAEAQRRPLPLERWRLWWESTRQAPRKTDRYVLVTTMP